MPGPDRTFKVSSNATPITPTTGPSSGCATHRSYQSPSASGGVTTVVVVTGGKVVVVTGGKVVVVVASCGVVVVTGGAVVTVVPLSSSAGGESVDASPHAASIKTATAAKAMMVFLMVGPPGVASSTHRSSL